MTLSRIRAIDYSVLYVRDMAAMRSFYADVMRFPLERTLGEGWIEYRIGANIPIIFIEVSLGTSSGGILPRTRPRSSGGH